jgi:hypothetical protein
VSSSKHNAAEWRCTLCTVAATAGTDENNDATLAATLVCCLCARRPANTTLKPTSDGRWAHVQCALFTPAACFADVAAAQTVVRSPQTKGGAFAKNAISANARKRECVDVSRVDIGAAALCVYCQQRGVGACVRCCVSKLPASALSATSSTASSTSSTTSCEQAFHVSCGREAGALFEYYAASTAAGVDEIVCVCVEHAAAWVAHYPAGMRPSRKRKAASSSTSTS